MLLSYSLNLLIAIGDICLSLCVLFAGANVLKNLFYSFFYEYGINFIELPFYSFFILKLLASDEGDYNSSEFLCVFLLTSNSLYDSGSPLLGLYNKN